MFLYQYQCLESFPLEYLALGLFPNESELQLDSPGHSCKWHDYPFADQDKNLILQLL
jgi:hypothetical protein